MMSPLTSPAQVPAQVSGSHPPRGVQKEHGCQRRSYLKAAVVDRVHGLGCTLDFPLYLHLGHGILCWRVAWGLSPLSLCPCLSEDADGDGESGDGACTTLRGGSQIFILPDGPTLPLLWPGACGCLASQGALLLPHKCPESGPLSILNRSPRNHCRDFGCHARSESIL